ncbi:MAG: hypothetical protein Tp132SUR00d2C45923861_13 [Prokaryotic dsDNA virus sp.]|nr:MAG: hypothetical protein Tp132SUR00d2C45923861_13 [Prokaryotic dsDNA virus sp.]|tara:strand:- start:13504 stop:15552 length:2049 start_codon:yes stop_codon:yes gene_type:complete
MYNPINRTTVQVEENKFRVYPKKGPLFYKKSNGELNEIDLTFNDSTSTIGDISLMNKGILSVGKRKDKNPYKITGIRPDNCQTGEKQLEFSVVNIELDDEKQDFDDIEILLSPNSIYQLVKLNKQFSKIKIEFDIHNTGLELINNKYEESTNICDYGFNLTNIGENTGSDTLGMYNGYNSLNKNISYLDFYIGKITDEYITTGEYTNEEEFGDSDLSEYTLEQMYLGGSSIYFKDCVILACKPYNIENYEECIVNNLCNLYELEILDDGGSGVYFTKDNKKVGGYYSNDNTFFAFFNTKDIPDKIKTLFKRKSFEDTSFLDITVSQLESGINSKFNKDLTINVDNSYYQGDFFQFKINNESIYINKPIAFNENFEQLNYYTTHTLKDNEDGSYRYTKYLLPESALNINDAPYIDATLSTSSSTDNAIFYRQASSSSTDTVKTQSAFDTLRGWTAGSRQATGSGTFEFCAGENHSYIVTSGQSGTVTTRTWKVFQGHFHFDSSGVSGTVTDLDFKYHAKHNRAGNSVHSDINAIFVKSNFDGTFPTTNLYGTTLYTTWNDFPGHSNNLGVPGWPGTDTTEYSGVQNLSSAVGIDVTTAFNADAKSDISANNDFAFCVLEYDEYYSYNLDTSFGNFTSSGSRYHLFLIDGVDSATASQRPYLEYTVAGSTPVATENATFFGANF